MSLRDLHCMSVREQWACAWLGSTSRTTGVAVLKASSGTPEAGDV